MMKRRSWDINPGVAAAARLTPAFPCSACRSAKRTSFSTEPEILGNGGALPSAATGEGERWAGTRPRFLASERSKSGSSAIGKRTRRGRVLLSVVIYSLRMIFSVMLVTIGRRRGWFYGWGLGWRNGLVVFCRGRQSSRPVGGKGFSDAAGVTGCCGGTGTLCGSKGCAGFAGSL